MKGLYTLILIFCVHLSYGQVRLGIGSSVIPEQTSFGAQIRGAYQYTQSVAFSGTFGYYFKKDSNIAIDLDAQFKLIDLNSVTISPFAGATIRETASSLGTGLQAGFFILVPTDGVDIYIEPKAILDNDTALVISGGLYF